jgi:quinol monooxygenase YgiN
VGVKPFDMNVSQTIYDRYRKLHYVVTSCTAVFVLTLLMSSSLVAQETNQMVRLAKIKVDRLRLVEYNAALKEQMATAVREEQGVLTYYAVADKADPSSITILEIYADTAAYKAHIETPHFKKYKETVKDMVKSLELVDVSLIGSANKQAK